MYSLACNGFKVATMGVSCKTVCAFIVSSALFGCSTAIVLEPAQSANNPNCAAVTVRLPQVLGNLVSRKTTAQATAAWGEPLGAVLRCGLPVQKPTTELCVSVNNVDWVINDKFNTNIHGVKFNVRAVTYGRSPAAEVFLDNFKISPATALATLGLAVNYLPKVASCS
ncbi:DUF3515 family protein [Tropheryma whipplei]|uniref:DUF3515 family protein n=2 Tax=Tropheryma whipplei TaxID=2039 RepID=Q83G29_TROWT|nr:DUF3515 family protein [Tropheryma whipplei]AAO44601.1 unknown [Tropheryma whipplei str. Twist]